MPAASASAPAPPPAGRAHPLLEPAKRQKHRWCGEGGCGSGSDGGAGEAATEAEAQ